MRFVSADGVRLAVLDEGGLDEEIARVLFLELEGGLVPGLTKAHQLIGEGQALRRVKRVEAPLGVRRLGEVTPGPGRAYGVH